MFNMKKVFAVTLAATTILGTSLTAFATTEAASSSSPATESSSGDESTTPTYASSTVAGVKSTAAGQILATKIDGAAVTTPSDALSANLGLAANEKAYVKVSDFDAKKSYAANAVAEAVLAAIPGASRGPAINFEVGKMTNGNYSQLDGGAVSASFAVAPSWAKSKSKLSAIKISVKGIGLLPDTDLNPYTISVNTTADPQVLVVIGQ